MQNGELSQRWGLVFDFGRKVKGMKKMSNCEPSITDDECWVGGLDERAKQSTIGYISCKKNASIIMHKLLRKTVGSK